MHMKAEKILKIKDVTSDFLAPTTTIARFILEVFHCIHDSMCILFFIVYIFKTEGSTANYTVFNVYMP